eukprot:CAMPEP_0177177402 /NCGR_PEP_ID=MMETSP0367-20130122/13778_1 /TAXON_ID=447022 ORGANISM="Scrippsiella hangoei-like, Strain SHHI-4" /NCGR_SAMPLE_ID=MMETSP0367 /ASSEMBLY_ACC=CAM_ASM_000362 /LENGTH=576 /DNA_ID=CAMNT_0018623995 /DNA_START=1 /DNA_END=1731 /DNA_ORIENTATION=+
MQYMAVGMVPQTFGQFPLATNVAPQIMMPMQLHQLQQLQQFQQFQQLQQVQQLQQLQLLQQQQHLAAGHAQQSKVATLIVAELTVAIASLYRDQLRPYGRILRKRIDELAQVWGRRELALDVNELRAWCSEFPQQLRVEEEGSHWVVLLSGQAQAFVDIYSPVDLYPEKLWRDAAAYFCGLPKSAHLPGGRYACAQILIQRRLPFLAGYSLGQVCHVVQLAINNKIMGYSNGMLVPYSRSQSMVKDRRAQLQQASIDSSSTTPVVTWGVLRRCVETLVEEVRAGGEPVDLSSIKRTFLTRLGVELSETALGHAKVSELLQDSRVSDLCRVELRAHGYVLLPLTEPPAAAVARSFLILADCLKEEERPTQSLEGEQSALRKRAGLIKPLSMDEIATPKASRTEAACESSDIVASVLPLSTPMTTLARTPQGLFPATPSPWSPWASAPPMQTLPTLLGRTLLAAPRSVRGSGGKTMATPLGSPVLDTLKEECSLLPSASECCSVKEPLMFLRPPMPSTFGRMSTVQNTFIHAAELEPEPTGRGRCETFLATPSSPYLGGNCTAECHEICTHRSNSRLF